MRRTNHDRGAVKTFCLGALIVVVLGAILDMACSNHGNSPESDLAPPSDMAMGGADMTPSCVKSPMTHVEIINACTTAQSYDTHPFYPALAPGGALPALP